MNRAALVTCVLVAIHAGAGAQTPTAAPATPPTMVPIARDDASTVLGRPVLDQQGETAGRITDVLVDANGTVRAAVVDFGGFLGVGQRRIAVAWTALRFDPANHTIQLAMSAPELAAAPEYKPGGSANSVVTRPQDIPRPSETHAVETPASETSGK